MWVKRAWVASVGLASFFWLASEASGLSVVLVLSGLLATTAVGPRWARQVKGERRIRRRLAVAALGGGMLGALVPLLAAGLMLVKISLHSHVQPDFSTEDLWAVLSRIPAWAVGGCLMGAAGGLVKGAPADQSAPE